MAFGARSEFSAAAPEAAQALAPDLIPFCLGGCHELSGTDSSD